jgi:hypothetical protein
MDEKRSASSNGTGALALRAIKRAGGLRRLLLPLAAVAATLAAPSLASALIPPACPSFDQEPTCVAEWHRYFAEAASEAVERKAAQENAPVVPPSMGPAAPAPEGSPEADAALAKAEREPVTAIYASVKAHPISNPTRPGYSKLLISTGPNAAYSWITIELKRGRGPGRSIPSNEAEVQWPPCDRAGMGDGFIVRYVIRARPISGTRTWTATKKGTLSVGSRKRCTWLNLRAARDSERRIRSEEQQATRERETAREELDRYSHNCEVLGGRVVILHTGEGNVYACRAPNGGILPVPH